MSRNVVYGWSRYPAEKGVSDGMLAGAIFGSAVTLGLASGPEWLTAVLMLLGIFLICRAWGNAESHREDATPEQTLQAGDRLVTAVLRLDSYAGMGGAPVDCTNAADEAVQHWRKIRP